MPGYGGLYKIEKKKPKKDSGKGIDPSSNPSVLVMPEIITKKKKDY